MYLTLEADYAVRIVSNLCLDGGRVEAKTLAERSCVTLRFALKILRNLVNAGIVKSYKGSKGGYMISSDPKDITLRMVIEAVEGTYCFSRCLLSDGNCNRGAESTCSYRKVFAEISKTVRDKLDSYNFADLIAGSEEFKDKKKNEPVPEQKDKIR